MKAAKIDLSAPLSVNAHMLNRFNKRADELIKIMKNQAESEEDQSNSPDVYYADAIKANKEFCEVSLDALDSKEFEVDQEELVEVPSIEKVANNDESLLKSPLSVILDQSELDDDESNDTISRAPSSHHEDLFKQIGLFRESDPTNSTDKKVN